MDPRPGLFTSPGWLAPPTPGVGTNRHAYSFNDPVNLSDPGGNMVVVTDQNDNDLFSLDDGLDDITRMTSSEAYDKKIQWFEESADNYMELISIAPGFADHPGVKHFSWDDIGQFADQDRASREYGKYGTANWKAVSQGGDGYRLVSVGGLPYWGDAVGQIPFTVDTYRMYRRQGDTHQEAAENTRADGLAYYDGSKILGTLRSWNPFWTPSDINNYDNAIIARTTAWAQFRWTYQALPRGGQSRETNTGYGYEGLAYR